MTYYKWKRIVGQSTPFLVAMSFFSVLAGYALESNLRLLEAYPSILLILPAFMSACGSISGTFATRLTSALQMGVINFRRRRKRITANVESTLAVSLIYFVVMSAIAYGLSSLIGFQAPSPLRYIAAVLLSAAVVVSSSILLAVGTAYITLRTARDPDNFESPILSTYCDMAGVFIFIHVCRIVFLGGL